MVRTSCDLERLLPFLRVTSDPWLDREQERRLLQELLEELCAEAASTGAWFHTWDKESQTYLLTGMHPAGHVASPWAEAVRTHVEHLEHASEILSTELLPVTSGSGELATRLLATTVRLRVSDEVIGVLVLRDVDKQRIDELAPRLIPFWTHVAIASSNALSAQEARRQQSDVLRANRRLTSVLGALEKRQSLVETLNAKLTEANRSLEQRTDELGRSRSELEESVRRLRETQEQLVHAGKMAAIGILAAGVAHEINNPLTYVIANLSFIERAVGRAMSSLPAAEAAELAEVVSEATEGAERVRTIVRDLRAAVRSNDEKRGPIDVRDVLDTSLKIAANEIRHRSRLVRSFEAVPLVHANEARLGQVFLNLLVNAAQSIQRGSVEENEIRVVTRSAPDGRVSVEIHDTGCGIEAKNFGRLFNPFFTTKPIGAGTGLGLWVCHGIVEAMGGEIRVQSTPGAGSAFTVLLPAATQNQLEKPAPAAVLARGNRAKVLIVDDEPAAARSLQRFFRDRDYDADVATSPRAALLRLQEGERFAAILCDIMMPELNGTQFARAVANLDHAQLERLIFVTGGVFDPSIERELSGFNNLRVDKPFDEGQLLGAVSQVMRSRDPVTSS